MFNSQIGPYAVGRIGILLLLGWSVLWHGGVRAADDEEVRRVENSIGRKLVLIPASEFVMGAPESEVGRGSYEGPQHRVGISHDFYLGQFEVTQDDWQTIMGENPSEWTAKDDEADDQARGMSTRRPVEQITWYDAVVFCNQLSRHERIEEYYTIENVTRDRGRVSNADITIRGGKGYRLPTESEWEYACRAGTATAFSFGAAMNERHGNIDGAYPPGTSVHIEALGRPTTVGSYEPNAFGLYDMHGNVGEWCFDWFDENAYSSRSDLTIDPAVSGDGELRIHRGGNFWLDADAARSAFRNANTPTFYMDDLGLRVARTAD